MRAVQFIRRLDRDNDGVVSYLEMLEGSQLLFGEEISGGFVETNKRLRELLATRGAEEEDDDCPIPDESSGGEDRHRVPRNRRGLGRRNPTRHGDPIAGFEFESGMRARVLPLFLFPRTPLNYQMRVPKQQGAKC